MIDTTSEFGSRADAALRREKVIWLTTVTSDGRPQQALVWFLYDGSRVLIYSHNKARRLANLERNGHVSLALNSDEWGSEMIVLTGTARIAPEIPSAADDPAYLEKYLDQIEREKSWDGVAGFVEQYSVPVEVTDLKLHGY